MRFPTVFTSYIVLTNFYPLLARSQCDLLSVACMLVGRVAFLLLQHHAPTVVAYSSPLLG